MNYGGLKFVSIRLQATLFKKILIKIFYIFILPSKRQLILLADVPLCIVSNVCLLAIIIICLFFSVYEITKESFFLFLILYIEGCVKIVSMLLKKNLKLS